MPPVPDPVWLDLSISCVFTLSFLFIFAVGFVLARVATKVASWFEAKSAPTLLIWRIAFPEVNVNLSEVNVSCVPSFLIKEYLSSSKGKNVSFVPAVTAELSWLAEWPMVTSNVFLIFKVADDISTSDIFSFGILVNKALSNDFSKGVVTSVRSGTSKEEPCVANKAPSVTPVTVATPVTIISLALTCVILTNDFKLLPNPPNLRILPTFNLPGNCSFPLVIVLIETLLASVPTPVIFADPKINWSVWTTSLTKLFADPTLPKSGPAYKDLTSAIPKDVTARAILLFSSPLIMIGSFGTNSPDLSYSVNEVVLLALDLKNPVAPLNLPFMNAGVACVIAWFRVTLLNVCTSNNEISYSFTLEFVALYDPDSKAKS